MELNDDIEFKMETGEVQNEITVETLDMKSHYFHVSNLNLLKHGLDLNQPVNIKSELLDDTYLHFNVYIDPEGECPDVDPLSDHNYDRAKKAELKCNSSKKLSKKITPEGSMAANQGDPSDLFDCEICKKTFNMAYLLKNHMRIHYPKKRFGCNVCNKTFAFSNHLRNHYLIHTGEKNFSCSVCQKMFRQEGHLLNHIRTHSGIKKFSCPLCNKRFTQNVHMKSHLKTHTGEKNYVCQICQKQFTQSGHLQMHMTVHTGERKYECTECGLKFKQSGHLKNHRKTHKPESK